MSDRGQAGKKTKAEKSEEKLEKNVKPQQTINEDLLCRCEGRRTQRFCENGTNTSWWKYHYCPKHSRSAKPKPTTAAR